MLGEGQEIIHGAHPRRPQALFLGGDQVGEVTRKAFASLLRLPAGAGEQRVIQGDGHIGHCYT